MPRTVASKSPSSVILAGRDSAHVGLDHLHEFLGGPRFVAVGIGIHDVRTNMALDDLGREAADGPTARSQQVHDLATLFLLDQSMLDGFDLSANSSNAVE